MEIMAEEQPIKWEEGNLTIRAALPTIILHEKTKENYDLRAIQIQFEIQEIPEVLFLAATQEVLVHREEALETVRPEARLEARREEKTKHYLFQFKF